MEAILLLALLQMIYSFLSTCRVNDAVSANTFRYVWVGALTDLVKHVITVGMAIHVVTHNEFAIIGTTVLGGIIGNALGHWYKLQQR